MSSTGFGYLVSVAFLVVAAFWTSPDRPQMFLDPHGGFMVFVGTAVIAVIAVPWEYIKRFFSMIRAVSRRMPDDSAEVLAQVIEIAEKGRVNMARVADVLPKITDLFLKDAAQLLVDGYDGPAIGQILRRRLEVQRERENADAKMFKNLGKYPPATGLIGTVMGMIALLGTLGQEGAESKIGPAMSVAMTATLYGVILANVVILPVADNLIFRTQKVIAKREMIIEGMTLIKQNTPPTVIKEILLSHLAPRQRQAFKEAGKTRQAA